MIVQPCTCATCAPVRVIPAHRILRGAAFAFPLVGLWWAIYTVLPS